MSKKLAAAIIGTGFICPVHIEALKRIDVPVRGILGSSLAKSVAAAARLGLPKGYKDLKELLNDNEVDVVHITSPNRHHFEQASAALKAGKHVLCEKPLAMNSEESSQLVEIAKAAGMFAGVNYNIRYYPLCIEAAERLKNGAFGRLFHVTGSYAQDWLFHKTDFNWRVLADEGGELRAVADIGTHLLDLIGYVTGRRVEAVFADLQTVYRERLRPEGEVKTFSGKDTQVKPTKEIAINTEDHGSILLRFEGGAKGVMWVSQVYAGRKNSLRFEIAGSAGSCAWDSESPNSIWLGHRDKPNESLIRDPSLMSARAAEFSAYPGGHNEGFPDTFKQLFRDFYHCVEGGKVPEKPTFPTFADGHQEILLCEAILKSHRDQQWVSL